MAFAACFLLLLLAPAVGSFAAARGRDYRLERRGQVVETVNTAGDGAALLERLRVLVGGSDPAIAPAAVRAPATQLDATAPSPLLITRTSISAQHYDPVGGAAAERRATVRLPNTRSRWRACVAAGRGASASGVACRSLPSSSSSSSLRPVGRREGRASYYYKLRHHSVVAVAAAVPAAALGYKPRDAPAGSWATRSYPITDGDRT